MLGLLWGLIVGTGLIGKSFKDSYEDTYSKMYLSDKDGIWYDSKGFKRNREGHKVYCGFDENGDYIIKDLKTGEIINKAADKRRSKWEAKMAERYKSGDTWMLYRESRELDNPWGMWGEERKLYKRQHEDDIGHFANPKNIYINKNGNEGFIFMISANYIFSELGTYMNRSRARGTIHNECIKKIHEGLDSFKNQKIYSDVYVFTNKEFKFVTFARYDDSVYTPEQMKHIEEWIPKDEFMTNGWVMSDSSKEGVSTTDLDIINGRKSFEKYEVNEGDEFRCSSDYLLRIKE